MTNPNLEIDRKADLNRDPLSGTPGAPDRAIAVAAMRMSGHVDNN